ncbi:MAG: FAD-dependent monooxygenase [Vicinamibacterales bacterium]
MACARRIIVVGGGPAGLTFAARLKRAQPRTAVTVLEREAPGAVDRTGIVLSQRALDSLQSAETAIHDAVLPHTVAWSTLEILPPGGAAVSVAGHPYVSLGRQALTSALEESAVSAGVVIERGRPVTSLEELNADLIVGADGAASVVRGLVESAVGVHRSVGGNRFTWLSTTHRAATFAFLFRRTNHGIWCAHVYPHGPDASTVIVECTDACWRAAGLERATPAASAAFLDGVFGSDLGGHGLTAAGGWRQFETVTCARWSAGPVVLIGDAAHTTHFSVGSGTRLALDDAIALADAVASHDRLDGALHAYEAARRPAVESLQRAARGSADWFEHVDRYAHLDADRFAFSLLTRSLRMTHADVKAGDPAFVDRVDRLVASEAAIQAESQAAARPAARGQSHTGAVPVAVTPPMFTPFRLRDLVVLNRIAVSPMCQYMAEDGVPNDWHLVHLGSRAIGGAGLVIAEMTDVSAHGRITPGCTGLYADAHVGAWKRIVDFIHSQSPANVGIQLGHAGRKGSTVRPWEGASDAPVVNGGWPVIAPSALPYRSDRSPTPRAMTRTDMSATVADFVAATERAEAAGFDLLEVHMAHGYLLASYISPLTNLRDDEYGLALENRMRFPLEVFDACRHAWPAHKPMSVRISAVDWVEGGTTADDAVAIAQMLRAHGCDIVDCSSGFTVPGFPPFARQFQTPFSDRLRHEAGIATMAVGGIASYADANTIIAAGRADLVLLGQEHLFNPYWTHHAAAAQGYALPWPKPYALLNNYRSRSGR